MKAFVTGGSGFIGSHLVDRLIHNGHEVTVYDQVRSEHLDPNANFVQGNLRSGTNIAHSMAGHDMVFHFAAHADVRSGTSNPTFDLEQNLLVTSNVLESMRQADVKYIVFSSTSMVYGKQLIFPTPENCEFPIQTSFYGASKIAAEGLIGAYCHGFGMKSIILRFVPVLGERYKHGHVFDFYNKLKANPDKIQVLGNGKQAKSYIYIKDAIDAITISFVGFDESIPVQIYNVGRRETYSVNQSLDVICRELKVNPVREYTGGEGGWAGDPPMILLDCNKLRALGWQPTVTIEDAILRTIRSFE